MQVERKEEEELYESQRKKKDNYVGHACVRGGGCRGQRKATGRVGERRRKQFWCCYRVKSH